MTIKETAGKTLLYFYKLQRTAPLTILHRQLGFINNKTGKVALTSDKKWFTSDLLDINASSSDIFNGFMFLLSKGYIHSKPRATASARVYVGIQLTAEGIDVIEGVESGQGGAQHFTETFNITVKSGTTVDTLVKDNLGKLLE